MEFALDVLVTLLQIALLVFLLWGASLCLRDLLGRPQTRTQPRDMRQVAMAEPTVWS